MIYIDPPYNTGAAKSYRDSFRGAGWLRDMEAALASLRLLLRDDGVIFISIDDSGYAELKLLCDRRFGKDNFCGTFITRQAQRSNSRLVRETFSQPEAWAGCALSSKEQPEKEVGGRSCNVMNGRHQWLE